MALEAGGMPAATLSQLTMEVQERKYKVLKKNKNFMSSGQVKRHNNKSPEDSVSWNTGQFFCRECEYACIQGNRSR